MISWPILCFSVIAASVLFTQSAGAATDVPGLVESGLVGAGVRDIVSTAVELLADARSIEVRTVVGSETLPTVADPTGVLAMPADATAPDDATVTAGLVTVTVTTASVDGVEHDVTSSNPSAAAARRIKRSPFQSQVIGRHPLCPLHRDDRWMYIGDKCRCLPAADGSGWSMDIITS